MIKKFTVFQNIEGLREIISNNKRENIIFFILMAGVL